MRPPGIDPLGAFWREVQLTGCFVVKTKIIWVLRNTWSWTGEHSLACANPTVA
ncbi:MAG: hypothetical protein HYY67_06855 [Thaumarchaeota archaeon]|nr:hypothetical protein [Nitrososphaerota archaeon]